MKKPQKQAFLTIHRNREAISRKAQGLPINTIIIAIIGLAVLFVLLFIFLKKGGEFGKATTGCESQGGQCIVGTSCSAISSGVQVGGTCPEGHMCCRSVVPQDKGASCRESIECASGSCNNGICS